MSSLFSAISGFLSKVTTLLLLGSFITLFAGEVRLAALKKASQGSSKLSNFTQKMTGTKSNF
jgi:hypothetical protein